MHDGVVSRNTPTLKVIINLLIESPFLDNKRDYCLNGQFLTSPHLTNKFDKKEINEYIGEIQGPGRIRT